MNEMARGKSRQSKLLVCATETGLVQIRDAQTLEVQHQVHHNLDCTGVLLLVL